MVEKKESALQGLRILDFTWFYAGPFATKLLADLGAEVIKVEPQLIGDPTRHFYKVFKKDGVAQSSYATSLNRGKKSLSINIKAEEGFKVICELIKKSDVVISNMAPGAMKSMGLGYDAAKTINPRIIYCLISCFGNMGSYANEPGFDIVSQAASGWAGQMEPPALAPVAIADCNAGVHASTAILAAIYYREKTGKGQEIDLSMTDCLFHLSEASAPAYLFSNRTIDCPPTAVHNGRWASSYAPYGMLEGRDGFIVIGALSDLLWDKLVSAMGKDYEWLRTNPRTDKLTTRLTTENAPFVHETLEKWVGSFPSIYDVEKILRTAGVPVMPVRTFQEAADAPYIREREMIVKLKQPFAGEIETYGSPFKMSETPGRAMGYAPLLGENNETVLSQVLNYSSEQIEKLQKDKVLYMEAAVNRLDEEKVRLEIKG
jgi:crotonobetainyl-CoA:carnitine CoA-transferase CaiB-like acyl-CoA transferase